MFRYVLILTYLFGLYTLIENKVVISEICTHTDEPYFDFIELYNDGKTSEDITGWYLSDDRQPRNKLKIKNTVLKPGEYKIFDTLKEGGFRMSKQVATVYLADKSVTVVDQHDVLSQTNHFTQSRYENSLGEIDFPLTFPTENFATRYPIVGPFVIEEILLFPEPGKQQYVKITCIRGTKIDLRQDVDKEEYTVAPQPFNGQAQMTTRENGAYELRFKQHKTVLSGTTKTTTPAFRIPFKTILNYLESIYIVSGDPDKFSSEMNIPRRLVFGPWNGNIDTTNGDRIALYADEGADVAHMFEAEKVKWKPQSPWPTRSGKNSFGIKRISLSSYANEPKNWKSIDSADTSCSKNSDCSVVVDSCTSGICISGKCAYTALNCDHPSYSKCYPSNFCLDTKLYGTCTISSAIYGHTGWWGSPDLDIFGWYTDSQKRDQMYWVAACPYRSLPSTKSANPSTGSGVHPGAGAGVHPTSSCNADNKGDGIFTQKCKFPFTFQGETFGECTTKGWGRLWCATELDGNGGILEYGVCQCGTNNAGEDETAQLTNTTNIGFGGYLGIGVGIGVFFGIVVFFLGKFTFS